VESLYYCLSYWFKVKDEVFYHVQQITNLTRGAIYLDVDLEKNAREHNIARLLFLMLPSPQNLLGYLQQSFKGRPSFPQFQHASCWSRLSAGMHALRTQPVMVRVMEDVLKQ
jgi:hypothetical protein